MSARVGDIVANRPPNMLVMSVPLDALHASVVAEYAATTARRLAPKLSGQSARRISAASGPGWFGLHWEDDYLWFQEAGTRGRTMRQLAGKTIPMWINDPTGSEQRRYPRAKTRVTASGKVQVLIFRRAAPMGSRKTVRRRVGTTMQEVDVPASYPGAPGRIAAREAPAPMTTPGRVGGQIARANIGVRWYHPGIAPRGWLQHAMREACRAHGVIPHDVVPTRSAR